MLLWIYKLVKSVRRALLSEDSAKQLAWGIALGLLLGLVPKGNLLAPCLLLGILCLAVNHTLAIATAAVVTLTGGFIDPLSHRIGLEILSQPSARDVLADFQRLPVAPWLSLNNTVVLGGFTLGLAALLPVYWVARPLLERYKARHQITPPPNPAAQMELRFDGPSEVRLETHIDVIRLSRQPESTPRRTPGTAPARVTEPTVGPSSESNEALRYLVRHVRDSREEKAA